MTTWTDRYWYSAEGLRLHYRDYDGPHEKPPILCIPGLTRNARDFAALAGRLAQDLPSKVETLKAIILRTPH